MSKAKTSKSENEIDETQILKDCFIITPIGLSDSDTFKKAEGLIKTVLAPVLRKFGFRPLPAYEISAVGSITKQVIDHVINDELVIANLTGLNPNVMYELALRHAFKKKVVIIAETDTKLPFDINDQRTIFYEDSLHGAQKLIPLLTKYVQEAVETEVSSNPVIDSVKESAVIKFSDDPTDSTKYILNRFDRLERLVMQSIDLYGTRAKVVSAINQPNRTSRTVIITSDRDLSLSIGLIVQGAKRHGVEIRSVDIDNGKATLQVRGSDFEVDSFANMVINELGIPNISQFIHE